MSFKPFETGVLRTLGMAGTACHFTEDLNLKYVCTRLLPLFYTFRTFFTRVQAYIRADIHTKTKFSFSLTPFLDPSNNFATSNSGGRG